MTIDRRSLIQGVAAVSAMSLVPAARAQTTAAVPEEVEIDSIQAGGVHVFEWTKEKPVFTFSFKSSRPRKIHIELIAGGGGGGGATKYGAAGKGGAAGEYKFQEYDLEPTRYLVELGKGGAGGVCRRNHTGEDGREGGPTLLRNARSKLVLIPTLGGAGGKHDAHSNPDRGGKGGDLKGNGRLIAKGGKGGKWDGDGARGETPGAGGGGHGGYDGPERDKGGDGGHGRAIIYFIS